mmetsp:Transcript_59676/g.109265  ORF Transcript_59676/g.109265 Transcript_59676/m.109265 type:complete len:282 (+) Transcript_59676:72-917(+)
MGAVAAPGLQGALRATEDVDLARCVAAIDPEDREKLQRALNTVYGEKAKSALPAAASGATASFPCTAVAGEVSSLIPGLPNFRPDVDNWGKGPHNTCNFTLPGRLISGSFPGDRKEPGHTQKMKDVLSAGVNTFVNLQETDELGRFTPYIPTARSLVLDPASLEFWHCPIPDNSVTADDELAKGVAKIVDALKRGRVVYVHCWGGHGRTGTIICAFLVQAYGLTTEQAQAHFMAGEQTRAERRGKWPHSSSQFNQVKALEGKPVLEYRTDGLKPLVDWSTK